MDPTPEPVRVAIVLDIGDPDPSLLFVWAAARAAKLIDELWNNGINADLVRIDIDGYPHLKR